MYFTFNTIHSSKYNLIIQNDIEDLKLIIDSGGKNSFASPQYQNGQYMLGLTKPQRKFPLKLVAQGLTRGEAISATEWLEQGTYGLLIFDFNTDWAYEVIVDKITDPNIYMDTDGEHCTISFSVDFVTVNSTYARSSRPAFAEINNGEQSPSVDGHTIKDTALIGFNNNLLIPAIILKNSEKDDSANKIQKTYRIHHLGNLHTDFSIDCVYSPAKQESNIDINLKISEGNDSYSEYVSLQARIGQALKDQYHVVQYNSKSSLFFTDNKVPEQNYLSGHFDKTGEYPFSCHYKSKPFEISRNYVPILIETLDEFDKIKDTIPNWFLIKPAQKTGNAATYYVANSGAYPPSLNLDQAKIYYSDDVDVLDDKNIFPAYFGAYSDLYIAHGTESEFTGAITIIQHTKVV
jgi:hypothetical protein